MPDQVEIRVVAGEQPERKQYRVLAKSGLFKRGKLHKKGGLIELDQETADRFKELSEVEDASE